MVPKGWDQKLLVDLIDGQIKNGYSPNPTDIVTGYWVLGLGSLGDHGINISGIKAVEPSPKVLQSRLETGDFLISRSNTPDKVGRTIRFKGEISNCSYPDLMMRFRIDTNKADPDFIELKLKSNGIRDYYSSCAAGSSSTMVKINKSVVEKTPILLPSIGEQKKIAKILSVWDKTITATEQLLTNSQQQKKALMQKLLTGKVRLLDENGVGFEGEWEKIEIGEFLKESRIPSKNNDPSKRITVRLNHKGIEPRELRGTEAIESTAHFIRKAGQFIYGKQNIHKGAFGIIPTHLDAYESSQDLPAFDFTEKCNSSWFLHFMRQDNFYYALEDKMTGTGSKRLNPKVFFKISILTPRIEEQQKIAELLTVADQEINLLKAKLIFLRQEKKALMQQLLTGKRRVSIN